MKPAFKVLNMFQGQTFGDSLILLDAVGAPIDLTGKSARMQARDANGAVKLDLTSANAKLVIPVGTGGVITFHLTAAELAAIPTQYDYEQWDYDLEVFYTSGLEEIVLTPVKGVVLFWPEITK